MEEIKHDFIFKNLELNDKRKIVTKYSNNVILMALRIYSN